VIRPSVKDKLHPRNRFRDGYDFPTLIAASPALAAFVRPNAHGSASVDYADPAAVKALNQALLIHTYGLTTWDVPPGYLCPPIPGRSDYLHYAADLIGAAGEAANVGRRGPLHPASSRATPVRVLDVGMGANCIYPIIGASEYGWHFVGSEIDFAALRWARSLVAANPGVANLIECRPQGSPHACFTGVIRPGEHFDLSMCNPPFHASASAAAEAARRKQRHLSGRTRAPVLNFGGQPGELWCAGGELAFVRRMIGESTAFAHQCRWFTTLVSKSEHLPRLQESLQDARAIDVRTIDMSHGQKKSRILAWTFRQD
jgi:23S rRNA (adenine1618-N6)-methyltransferase